MPAASRIALMSVVVVTLSAAMLAQSPTPGPEHRKLSGLVGTWQSEGTFEESPFGPAQKWSCSIRAEWFPGKFAVVRHEQGKGSVSGDIPSLGVVAYDSATKTYTWYGIDSTGFTGLGKVTVAGDVLTAMWEQHAKGKTWKLRGTYRGLGSDKPTWVQEYSEDGNTWKAYFHATDTRVKGSN